MRAGAPTPETSGSSSSKDRRRAAPQCWKETGIEPPHSFRVRPEAVGTGQVLPRHSRDFIGEGETALSP